MWRIAGPGGGVGFLDRNDAAGPGDPDHLCEDLFGIADVQEQGARVHNVKGIFRQAACRGVCLHELDVRGPLFGETASRLQDARLTLQTDNASTGADALREHVQHSHHAAPDVDRGHAGFDPDQIEELVCLGSVNRRLLDEMVDLGRAVPEQIPTRTGGVGAGRRASRAHGSTSRVGAADGP
jgi:hypothetical protein